MFIYFICVFIFHGPRHSLNKLIPFGNERCAGLQLTEEPGEQTKETLSKFCFYFSNSDKMAYITMLKVL